MSGFFFVFFKHERTNTIKITHSDTPIHKWQEQEYELGVTDDTAKISKNKRYNSQWKSEMSDG